VSKLTQLLKNLCSANRRFSACLRQPLTFHFSGVRPAFGRPEHCTAAVSGLPSADLNITILQTLPLLRKVAAQSKPVGINPSKPPFAFVAHTGYRLSRRSGCINRVRFILASLLLGEYSAFLIRNRGRLRTHCVSPRGLTRKAS